MSGAYFSLHPAPDGRAEAVAIIKSGDVATHGKKVYFHKFVETGGPRWGYTGPEEVPSFTYQRGGFSGNAFQVPEPPRKKKRNSSEELWGGWLPMGLDEFNANTDTKEKRVHFDEKEEKKDVLRSILKRKKAREPPSYPPPPKHPDQMTEAELKAYLSPLSIEAQEQFARDYQLDESGSDGDDEDEGDEDDEKWDSYACGECKCHVDECKVPPNSDYHRYVRAKLTEQFAHRPDLLELIGVSTAPLPMPPPEPQPAAAPVPMAPPPGTPLQRLGEQFAQNGRGGRHLTKRERSVLRANLNKPGAGSAVPSYDEIKNPERRQLLADRHEEAIEQVGNQNAGKRVEVPDGARVEPLWSRSRRCFYCVGAQGAGKSRWAAMIAANWKADNPRPASVSMMSPQQHQKFQSWKASQEKFKKKSDAEAYQVYPAGQVFVFSVLTEDPSLDRIGIVRVPINQGFLDSPFKPEELFDCFLVFDDIDSIRDPKMCAAAQKLCDDNLEDGRHRNVGVLRTSHKFMNWNATAKAIQESDWVCFFINKSPPRAIKKFLSEYMLLDNETIWQIIGNHGNKSIKGIQSPWICLATHQPFFVVGTNELRIL